MLAKAILIFYLIFMESKLSRKEFVNCSALVPELNVSYYSICVKKAHDNYWNVSQSWDLRKSWVIHTWSFYVSTENLFHSKLATCCLGLLAKLASNVIPLPVVLQICDAVLSEYMTHYGCDLLGHPLGRCLVHNIHLNITLKPYRLESWVQAELWAKETTENMHSSPLKLLKQKV